MALLALAMPPAQAAALLILPSLVTNVWPMRPWPTLAPMTRRLWPMQAGVVVGTLGGAWLLGAPAGAWAMQALGAALVVYGLWGLSGARVSQVPAGAERVLGPLVGAVIASVGRPRPTTPLTSPASRKTVVVNSIRERLRWGRVVMVLAWWMAPLFRLQHRPTMRNGRGQPQAMPYSQRRKTRRCISTSPTCACFCTCRKPAPSPAARRPAA